MITIFIAGLLSDHQTGYGVHTSSFFRAMQAVSPFPVRGIDVTPRRGRAMDFPTKDDVIIVVGGGPGVAMFDGCPARKVAFTMWESTRLPDDWIEPLSRADEVWTPTRWGADVLQANGIDASRTYVVPEGIDDTLFRPDGEHLSLLDGVEGFRFLHVGKAEPRKGTIELLQAFDRAFDDDDPVYLVVACQNRLIPGFDTVRFIENMGLKRRRWIVPIQPLPQRQDMAALFRSCDAFVAPSRCEGWGLPALEAMASGLPTALTHYSGHTAFADRDNSIAIPFNLVPITAGALPRFARSDADYGEWAEPDVDGLAEVMRGIRRNHEALRRRALRQAAEIGQRLSWTNAAAQACFRVSDLIARHIHLAAEC